MNTLTQVVSHLATLRRGLRTWALLTGALALVATACWIAAVFVLTDLQVQFGGGGRWVGFLLLAGGVCALAVATWRVLARQLSDANLGRRIEAVRPELGNRLINVVQFGGSGPDANPAFAERLLAESPLPLSGVRAADLFPQRLARYAGLGAGLALLILIALGLLAPQGTATSLRRLVMPFANIAPYTLTRIVSVEPGTTSVPRGQAVTVTAVFGGALPATAILELGGERQETRRLEMQADPDDATRFVLTTPALFVDSTYRVFGGDARGETFTVGVDSPPAMVSWSAAITPPAYTHLPPLTLAPDADGKLPPNAGAPVGSVVVATVTASQPLASLTLKQGELELATASPEPAAAAVVVKATVPGSGPLGITMTSARDLTGNAGLPLPMLPDAPPMVDFVDVEARLIGTPDGTVALPFRALDEYGLASVRLEMLPAEGPAETITSVTAPGDDRKQFAGRFLLELKTFKLKPPASLRVRLVATDHGPDADVRRGLSRVVEIVLPMAEDRAKLRKDAQAQARATLNRLIKLQQETLDATRTMQKRVEHASTAAAPAIQELLANQSMVQSLAADLMKQGDALGDLQNRLDGLLQHEMPGAVAALDRLARAAAAEQQPELKTAVEFQTTILSVLLGMPPAMDFEQQYAQRSDLLSALQKLAEAQRKNVKASRTGQTEKWAGDPVADLVIEQEDIADGASRFLDAAASFGGQAAQDDFAKAVTAARTLLETGGIYEKGLTAADLLQKVDWPAAIQTEEECLTLLMGALDILNRWRVNQAKASIENAATTLKDISEKLGELEDKQREIVETTKDLTKRGTLTDEIREELAKMDEEQKEMMPILEKMAQDLYQFPELPVANELNAKMRELYEDVQQVTDSEKAPAVTIAVQKEESFLDAIAKTKERVEDIEMWLPDVPDNIKWDMESFDASEFPEMPLVPLPEELEDIVGDLLDLASDVEDAAQDSTGNNMMADGEMGWGIMDGPIPNFSAKGKSGNMKPNDNEMTGRSGAGREGQATGELAENKVKGLEGRDTHARRTNDALQTGQVEEEEGSTLDARATGGGKLGGVSENDGMFGDAPRRDLQMTAPGGQQGLRQETEALYATARLLYLGNTRSLGAAGDEMRRLERPDAQQRGFDALQQKVVRRLQDSQTEIGSGATLALPVTTRATSGGNAQHEDVDLNKVSEDYRDIIADYYKNLGD